MASEDKPLWLDPPFFNFLWQANYVERINISVQVAFLIIQDFNNTIYALTFEQMIDNVSHLVKKS